MTSSCSTRPATGHALGMLGSPQTFGAIARVGPIAGQTHAGAGAARRALRAPAIWRWRTATEMAVTETLELQDGLRERLGRDLTRSIVNGAAAAALHARRAASAGATRAGWTPTTARSPRSQRGATTQLTAPDERQAVIDSAVRAALAVHERARFQRNQLARLRRRSFEVVGVPFVCGPQLDLGALAAIASRLERGL